MSLRQIPNPYGLSWTTWVDTLVGFNSTINASASPDLPWRMFAQRLAEFEVYAPRADFFENWEDWAAALKLAYPD